MGFINAIKNGWYAGKGFKASRHEKYEKALYYYDLALKYSDNCHDPVIYDSMAFALYKLNRYEEAVINTRKSLEQYSSYKGDYQKIYERIERLKGLEELLQKKK